MNDFINATKVNFTEFYARNPFKIKDLSELFSTTAKEWYRKDPFRGSAVIAYYAIFSIPGLLVLIVTIAGYFFDKQTISDNIIGQIGTTLGADTAYQINDMLTKAGASKSTLWGQLLAFRPF